MQNLLDEARAKNPYPKDIFTEPSKDEYNRLQKAIKDIGLIQDKFFGSFGRRVWNSCIDTIAQLMEEENDITKCPFRRRSNLTNEPSSYCMIGDCMFDPKDEKKCGIFITHLKLICQREAQASIEKV